MHIAWTGHRPELFADPAEAERVVGSTARELIGEQPPEGFIVGGQRGVDTWAALAAHELQIPFVLVLPLEVGPFTRDWSVQDRRVLEQTLGWAAAVEIVSGDQRHAYSKRNQRIATTGDLLVAVWTRISGGGTAETIAFAREAGTRIREIILAPSREASRLRGRGI
jgi:hypothetical protein